MLACSASLCANAIANYEVKPPAYRAVAACVGLLLLGPEHVDRVTIAIAHMKSST
jgi:hypothetical protein